MPQDGLLTEAPRLLILAVLTYLHPCLSLTYIPYIHILINAPPPPSRRCCPPMPAPSGRGRAGRIAPWWPPLPSDCQCPSPVVCVLRWMDGWVRGLWGWSGWGVIKWWFIGSIQGSGGAYHPRLRCKSSRKRPTKQQQYTLTHTRGLKTPSMLRSIHHTNQSTQSNSSLDPNSRTQSPIVRKEKGGEDAACVCPCPCAMPAAGAAPAATMDDDSSRSEGRTRKVVLLRLRLA